MTTRLILSMMALTLLIGQASADKGHYRMGGKGQANPLSVLFRPPQKKGDQPAPPKPADPAPEEPKPAEPEPVPVPADVPNPMASLPVPVPVIAAPTVPAVPPAAAPLSAQATVAIALGGLFAAMIVAGLALMAVGGRQGAPKYRRRRREGAD